jgi:amidase
MSDLMDLSLRELARRLARRDVAVEAAVRASIARIEEREPAVRAWQYFDRELALAQARRLDHEGPIGPLYGLPVGVKDLMDSADMPTTYGSPIYAGHWPRFDAACVAASRAAGAVIMGKTVTTEFATFQPGPTRNPRAGSAERSPGGSSSGSAAAVGAGMVRAAFGTQTAGSIVRPAAFCGVVGYKPTHGTLPLAGIKMLSPSLDTVGVLARTVDDAAYLVGALARIPLRPGEQAAAPRLRIGICQTPHWDRAGADARRAMADAAGLLERAGALLVDLALPATCDGLADAQIRIMGYEGAAAFAPESADAADGFSPAFAAFLGAGRQIDGSAYADAQALAAAGRNAVAGVFERVDILLAPSAEGEAPAGLASTGDPIFNRMWSLLGNPCVHVPIGRGASGMPVGVTLVGPRWADAATLAAAWLLESRVEATIE